MRRRLHGIDPWRFAAADDPEWHPDDTCLWCLEQGWATLDSASFENGNQLGSNVEQDQVVTGTGQWSAAATPFSAASNGSNLSVCCVTIRCMEVTARAVEAIPRGNLHVSRDEFVALWRLVEHLGETVCRGRVECILVFRASRSDAWVCYRRGADGPLGRRSGFRYGRCRLLWLLRAVPRVCRSSAFASASGSVAGRYAGRGVVSRGLEVFRVGFRRLVAGLGD
jgi:hypothetical protein